MNVIFSEINTLVEIRYAITGQSTTMLGYFNKLMAIIFLLCITNVTAQEDLVDAVNKAKDSIKRNPEYTYKTLSKLLKKEEVAKNLQIAIRLNLGQYFYNSGVADSTIYYANSTLPLITAQSDTAVAYRLLGSGNRLAGNYEEAFKWLIKSLKITEKINDVEAVSMIKSDLGILYSIKNDFDKALRYLQESVETTSQGRLKSSNYIRIGLLYLKKENLNLAEENLNKGLKNIVIRDVPQSGVSALLSLGKIAREKDEYNLAKQYFLKAKGHADQYGLLVQSIEIKRNLGLLQDLQGDHRAAILTLSQALVEAKNMSDLESQKEINKSLSFVHAKILDYKVANTYQKEFYKLQDSLDRRKFTKEINELEIEYKTDKQKKQVQLLQVVTDNQKLLLKDQEEAHNAFKLATALTGEQNKNKILSLENEAQRAEVENFKLKEEQRAKEEEIRRQRTFKKSVLIGTLLVLVPVTILLITYYQKLKAQIALNASQEEVNRQKVSSLIKDQELKLIKTSVNAQNKERKRISEELHDSIGGNLASIKLQLSSLDTKENKVDKVMLQLDETYDQVRDISHTLISEKFQQNVFTTLLKEYIKTITDSSDRSIITFEPYPEEEINNIAENIKVALFKIIQELLTNTLKHANAKRVEIHLNIHDKHIKLLFEDNGKGFDATKTNKGIGFKNIENRLEKLSGSFIIDSFPKRGTVIDIDIPLYKKTT